MAKKKNAWQVSVANKRKKAIKEFEHHFFDDELINFQRGKTTQWEDLKHWGDIFGYTPEEVARLILREVNRHGKKVTDLPYREQKKFFNLYSKHDTPSQAFKDEKIKKWFHNNRIKCGRVEVLKKHWTDLNRAIGTIKKGNYKKPHYRD